MVNGPVEYLLGFVVRERRKGKGVGVNQGRGRGLGMCEKAAVG